MLQRVMINGIKLPRLYIAENEEDILLAQQNGIPYIRWKQGQKALIRMLLRPTLEHMFPHIKWNLVLGPKRMFMTEVELCDTNGETITGGRAGIGTTTYDDDSDTIIEGASVANDERLFGHDVSEVGAMPTSKLDIETYVGDMSSYVNLEVLQRLRLMPAFIGDILDCVRTNIGNGTYWSEGYNKRLGLPVGRYDSARQLRNLIILDVSGSIPRGISATMLTLVDTLRTQLSADLIITSDISRFYPMGEELPTPQELRDKFSYNNESKEFFKILQRNIRGHHYGHVISFGDHDTPDYWWGKCSGEYDLQGITVDHVHHYHTCVNGWYGDMKTGYAKWCHMLPKKPIESYDTSWCRMIKKRVE